MDSFAKRTRTALAAALVAAVLVCLFAIQNTGPIAIHFLFWTAAGVPLFAVIVLSLVLGVALGWTIAALTSEARGVETPAPDRAEPAAPVEAEPTDRAEQKPTADAPISES